MHLECPEVLVDGNCLREALENVFEKNPKLRGYVLDDQQRLRHHVVIFIDDQVIQDRVKQTDSLQADSEVYIMQALSGG
jgi:sulfur-carrier protein